MNAYSELGTVKDMCIKEGKEVVVLGILFLYLFNLESLFYFCGSQTLKNEKALVAK